MYIPNLSDFRPFSLERLLSTCFGLPQQNLTSCVLIDLEDPRDVANLNFLQMSGSEVQKKGVTYFYEPLRTAVGKNLGILDCDIFAFNKTGGSNLDPENVLFDIHGHEMTFTEHICPKYDLIFAITDYSLTAPLTSMAKKYGFRGATLHGLNDIILNSGLSVDYQLVSRQAELFRAFLDQADRFKLNFE